MVRLFKADFEVDFSFFAILPAFNINSNSTYVTIEFEWFVFGLYIDILPPNKIEKPFELLNSDERLERNRKVLENLK